MSNLSVVNANNLDSRYTTPAQVDTKIAAASNASPTRVGAYSFGGGDYQGYMPASSNLAVRYRFMLTQTVKRIRVRYRNYDGLKDGGNYSPAGVRIGKTYVGTEQSGSPLTYAAAPQLVDSTGTGSGTISGLTEYVTPWFTPTANSLKPGTTLLLSHEVINPTGGDITAACSAASGGYYNVDATTVNSTANSGYAFIDALPCEIVLEYEYASTAKVGLFIGHSFVDSYSGSKTGWWGQHTGWPQQWARRTGNVAVVNAYAGSATGDWGSGSQKWDRFPSTPPDFILVSLIANDILYGANSSSAQSAYSTLFATVHAKYPGVPVYATIDAPYGSTSGSIAETARLAINSWLPTVTDSLDLAGVIDFDRPTRDATNPNKLAPEFVSIDNLHPTVRGYMVFADQMTTIS